MRQVRQVKPQPIDIKFPVQTRRLASPENTFANRHSNYTPWLFPRMFYANMLKGKVAIKLPSVSQHPQSRGNPLWNDHPSFLLFLFSSDNECAKKWRATAKTSSINCWSSPGVFTSDGLTQLNHASSGISNPASDKKISAKKGNTIL